MSTVDVPPNELETKNPLAKMKLEGEILELAEKNFKLAREQRQQFEPQWYVNMAFFFGKQWVTWQQGLDGGSRFARLVQPAAPPWRVRLVANKVRPIIRGELAKLTKEKPRGFVVPRTSDEKDIKAAEAAESLMEWLWDNLDMQRKIRRAMFWNIIHGTSIIKDWYDKDTIDPAGVRGSIETEVLNVFQFLVPEIQEEEMEGQPFVIHTIGKDPGWVKDKYGKAVDPDINNQAGLLEQKFLSVLGIKQAKGANKLVAVKEMWLKPTSKYKDGLVVTWAGDSLLQVHEGFGYTHREYPFTKFEHVPAGRFYGTSVIEDLIPLQKEYNRTRSQIIESKNRMSKPQLIAARGSIDANKITSEPGLVIQYTPGFNPPAPLPLQSIPSYVMQELERNQIDMDDVSAQHEVTKGRVPPGVEAATAISFLVEQDDSKLSHTIASLEEGVARIGQHFLNHVKDFWVAERIIQVAGENNSWESLVFMNETLQGNTAYRVESGSATPQSKAAKQAFLMEMADKGYIPPDRLLKYLDMGETAKLYDEIQLDSRQALRENLKMAEGEQVQANPFDNHMAHITEHDNYKKKQEYEALDPIAKQNFILHDMMHHAFLSQELGLPINPATGRIPLSMLQFGGQGAPQPGSSPQQ